METSDDEGDPAAARALLLLSFLFICYQPQSRTRHSTAPPPPKAAPPVRAAVRAVKAKKARKKLYLTFDDGPNRGTRNVWTIVRDEGVPASFFLVGEHVFDSRGQRALYDSLRGTPSLALCNHSYCHARLRYSSYYGTPDSVVADFRRTAESLGLSNAVARTPGRNIWRIDSLRATDLKASAPAADSLQGAGFRLMGWDAEWTFDHTTYNVEQDAVTLLRQLDSVYARQRLKRPGHLVLLAHDQAFAAPADSLQLRKFLQALKKRDDYELALATEYPGAN
ncbi:MAG: hypothetical protein EOO12_14510 [Chitinophagaceae bacterium]|nr:MAG: hypothetical protein EOO12_14510 [Chitinophagaceae bacterium]